MTPEQAVMLIQALIDALKLTRKERDQLELALAVLTKKEKK